MGKLGLSVAAVVALAAVLCLGVAHLHEEGLRLSWPHFCSAFPSAVRPLLPICNGCSFCAPPSALLLQELMPHLQALAAKVHIVRDDHGIPHVYGERDSDVAFGLAYVQCEDHFDIVQELVLRSKCRSSLIPGRGKTMGRGPLSQNSILSDSLCLLFEFDRQVIKAYATQMTPATKEILSRFADGMNYYAATHVGDILLEDTKLLFPLNGQDITLAMLARLPLLMEVEPLLELVLKEDPYYVVSFATEDMEHVEEFSASPSSQAASTAYAVRSDRTTDGSTVLVANPHYHWEGPFHLFEAHAHSEEGWNTYGGMWLATPSFPSGVNDDIAWAHTLNFPDVTDVYLLDVDDANPSSMLFDGEYIPLREQEHELPEPLWGPFYWHHSVKTLFSPYGPVLKRNHGSYAFRWAGHGKVGQLQQLHCMSKASTLEEWDAALAAQSLPLLSFLYADREDNILLQYNGLLPKRDEGFLWHVMVDGSNPRTLWKSYHGLQSLPRVLNPSASFLVAANSSPFNCTGREHNDRGGHGDNPLPEAYAFEHGIESHITNRAQRLIQLLKGDRKLSLEDVKAMKWDDEYGEEEAIIDVLVHVVDKLRELQFSNPQVAANATISAAVDLLASWDRRTDPDNRAAALAVLTASPFIKRGASDPLDYVRKNFVVVIQRFLEVAARLEEAFGRIDVPWGDVQRLRVDGLDIPLGGAPDVLRTVYSRELAKGGVEAVGGDGFVMVAAFQESPGGQRRLYAEATNPNDGRGFADMDMRPIRFHEEDVFAHTAERYTPLERV